MAFDRAMHCRGSAMPINLPRPIAAYFAADRADGEAVARCFTEDAVVQDEGRTHGGRPAIAAWKADASARYAYTSEPVAMDESDGRTVVTCHLAGDFPGSPVDLRFFFRLQGDKIASLEIIP
ncbi:nuclear transport factor 2 family protein [Sphingomonas sp. MM-1]|uniref:nuclear transport factor 2 family protein n=1 Tax=Sphingomonas sp. MM-1 TaxID=745310 RepID=UPI001F45ABD3|nr:nuclear transport factor 2 family protein [Sphingomonas sp. MM-1]